VPRFLRQLLDFFENLWTTGLKAHYEEHEHYRWTSIYYLDYIPAQCELHFISIKHNLCFKVKDCKQDSLNICSAQFLLNGVEAEEYAQL